MEENKGYNFKNYLRNEKAYTYYVQCLNKDITQEKAKNPNLFGLGKSLYDSINRCNHPNKKIKAGTLEELCRYIGEEIEEKGEAIVRINIAPGFYNREYHLAERFYSENAQDSEENLIPVGIKNIKYLLPKYEISSDGLGKIKMQKKESMRAA